MRNADQKLKLPCAASARMGTSRARWSQTVPVDVWRREKKETLHSGELWTKKTRGGPYKGIYQAGGANTLGLILRCDFELHFAEGAARFGSFTRTIQRWQTRFDALGCRDVHVEDGVGDERPTYVLTGAAKKFKVPNSADTDSSRDWVAKSVS